MVTNNATVAFPLVAGLSTSGTTVAISVTCETVAAGMMNVTGVMTFQLHLVQQLNC